MASVLLKNTLSQQAWQDILHWLRHIATDLWTETGQARFYVRNGMLIDVPDAGENIGSQFVLTIEQASDFDDIELLQIEQCASYIPGQVLTFSAGTHRELDARILGHLVLSLAQRFESWIKIPGTLVLPNPSASPADADHTATGKQTHVGSAFFDRFPGTICEIEYEAIDGEHDFYHIVDVEFLRAWIDFPSSYMIM
jgi:hypothetical protein